MSLFYNLEDEAIADLARRVKKTGRYTETAELMAKAMVEEGYSADQIRSKVMKILRADRQLEMQIAENTKAYKQYIQDIINQTLKEAEEAGEMLIADAANMAWNNDLSMWEQHGVDLKKPNTLSQLMIAFRKQTNDMLRNLTRTTGFKDTNLGTVGILNAYQKEMDMALLKVATGTFSFDQAVNDCVHRLAKSGLRSIDYANGRTYQLDTATRMAVRTGMSQLSGKITEANLESTGHDLVITSQHMGSRPEHANWQNKVFSYSGKNKKYPDFKKSTGYGTVTGLKGANCSHDYFPYWEGASVIPKDLEYDEEYYKNTQKQRKMERDIRATKREIEAQKAIGGNTAELQSRLRRQTSDYRKFSDSVGLKTKDNRLRVKAGTSDLKKTKVQKANTVKFNDGMKKAVYRVEGSSKIFEGKSVQEKMETAINLIAGYTDRNSKWNGKVIENSELRANGRFYLQGHIEVKPNANNRTFIHEGLHSYSAPYISKNRYVKVHQMEEAAVEFLAREICNEHSIPYSYTDNVAVDALVQINKIMKIEDSNASFAKLVYNIDPDYRVTWLSGKVERYVKKHPEKKTELRELLEHLR